MDSMRSLNTSLPSARRRPQPPAQLLQAFKTAALQVTNLYKAAAADHSQAHEAGYQAALEDMLSFLDAENLGVGDGEGWRVRQWVTEKLQEGMGNSSAALDSDDDTADDDNKRARSSSPIVQRRPAPPAPVVAAPTEEVSSSAPAPAPAPAARTQNNESSASPEPAAESTVPPTAASFDALPKSDFSFRSTQPLPAQHDLDMDAADGESVDDDAAAPMQMINVFPRHHHNHARPGNHHHNRNAASHPRNNHSREGNRAAAAATAAAVASLGNLGQGAGLKRRAPLGDFFDITGFGGGKDMFGGGPKRGRFT